MNKACLLFLAAGMVPALGFGCSEPELAPLPARCSDGQCPEGLSCIHGVCAPPGTAIPITVAELEQLKPNDLRIFPQDASVLVTFQTYAYSAQGQRFIGVRVRPDGSLSPEMTLVSNFIIDEESNEPYYDILQLSSNDLLMAISAAPLLEDNNPSPRLITYRVTLPPEGQEGAGVQFGAAWESEQRMKTIGYGAVSKPKLLKRKNKNSVELGYFETRADNTAGNEKTLGELVVFQMNDDGSLKQPPTLAPVLARTSLPVAVGVEDAFEASSGAFWVLDNGRPSLLLMADSGNTAEAELERLSLGTWVDNNVLYYMEPSERSGEKLPTGPVTGPAVLHRAEHVVTGGMMSMDTIITDKAMDLPPVRDFARPAWLTRVGKAAIVVTPGTEYQSDRLYVHTVDAASKTSSKIAEIERFSQSNLDALGAAVAGGKLYIAWLDVSSTATIRMAILDEP